MTIADGVDRHLCRAMQAFTENIPTEAVTRMKKPAGMFQPQRDLKRCAKECLKQNASPWLGTVRDAFATRVPTGAGALFPVLSGQNYRARPPSTPLREAWHAHLHPGTVQSAWRGIKVGSIRQKDEINSGHTPRS